MIIPYQQISADALQALIEEFITREGTDYGDVEIELEHKVAQIRQMLKRGDVAIVFDTSLQTTTILPSRDARLRERASGADD